MKLMKNIFWFAVVTVIAWLVVVALNHGHLTPGH